jgi:hypothetical protein
LKHRVQACIAYSAAGEYNKELDATLAARASYARPNFNTNCIKVFADLSDGCNICKPFADCGDGFTNSFNRSGCDFGDGFFNRSSDLA